MTSPRTVALLFALAATPGHGLHFHYDGSSANASAALHDTPATSEVLRNALSSSLKHVKQNLSAASSTLRLEMAAVAETMRTVNSSLVTARDAVLSFMEQMDEAFTSLSLEVLAILAQAEDLADTLVGGANVSDLVADSIDDICENPIMMMASAREKLTKLKNFLDTNAIEDIEEQLVNPVVDAADAILDPLQAAATSFPVDGIEYMATSALQKVDGMAAAVVKEATSMISIAKEAISTVEEALTILGPILAPACAVVSITRR